MIEQISKTTFQKLIPSGDRVLIGDTDSVDFKPHLKLNRWDGECFIKVGLPVAEKSLPIIDGDKITWEGKDRHILMYPLAPDKQMELGGYEYEIVLEKRPRSNKIILDIQSQGLRFDYQPALTQQEIELGISRPENVAGSYAVYHTTKGGMVSSRGKDYKTGKAFHIFRPRIVNAIGQWMWEEQLIENGKQIITMPMEMIEGGHYPLRHIAGDTFGYTSKGSSVQGFENAIVGGVFTCPGAGTGISIKAWLEVTTAAKDVKCALYDGTNEVDYVTNGTTDKNEIAVSDVENTFNFASAPTLVGQAYAIVAWGAAGSGVGRLRLDVNGGTLVLKTNQTINGWPDPIPSGWSNYLTDFAQMSIYCTYTPAAGGLPIPVAMHHYKMMRS